MDSLLLLGFAFLAGLLDAAVGGGGLIQIPALFSFAPGFAPATLFGTNKLASIAGTGTASVRYAQDLTIPWRTILPAAASAFFCAFLGALAVAAVPAKAIRPAVLVLLIAVAFYTHRNKNFGAAPVPKYRGRKAQIYGGAAGGVIGFYDGLFGPGTGNLLIFMLIRVFGLDFLTASAAAKVVNVATNLSAVLYFGFSGNIAYSLAVPMAVCNALGSYTGARMAISRGSGFLRKFFLLAVCAMIAKFAYDTFA